MIVGVGDADRGDDGLGPLIARTLTDAGVPDVIDGCAFPELETWRIRDLAPETVLFLDAADFGGAPGDAAVLAAEDLRTCGFDTHRAPLRLTMEYLEHELGCRSWLLAIQPMDVRIGARMCDEVRESSARIAEMLAASIETCKT